MIHTYLLGLGWIGGLLVQSLAYGWVLPLVVCGVGAALGRRDRRLVTTWAVTGLVALSAISYLTLRQPIAGSRDVSRLEAGNVTVVGHVQSMPRPTRSGRYQFWLKVEMAQAEAHTGRLYVTYPETTPIIVPGQTLQLSGYLYQPSAAENPGSFDFADFLARQGAFAGLSAREAEIIAPSSGLGGWAMRSRIAATFQRALGDRHGGLLSGMVLGASASPVEPEVRAAFRTVGLSHVMAASGFHVALLVGVVLGITEKQPRSKRQIITLLVLVAYGVLTGGSPSVLRASLMASAAVLLLENPAKQRLNPVGMLLIVAVILLLIKPLWIRDLGFQLSFMATLGLLVSTRPIQARLVFLPNAIAAAASIPIAALLWTLPLQLSIFGEISAYALLANLVTMPLITTVIIAGFIAASVSLLVPDIGYFVTLPLTLVVTPLDNLVQWMASWPNPTLYTGVISGWHCAALYAALGLTTLSLWRWRRAIAIVLVAWVVLSGFWPFQPPQLVALADAPVLVMRTAGETTLINSGDADTVERVVIPYLRYHGIGHIDRAIALNSGANSGWLELETLMPITASWGAETLQAHSVIPGKVPLIIRGDGGLQATIAQYDWLLLGSIQPSEAIASDGIWWDGRPLPSLAATTGLVSAGFGGSDRSAASPPQLSVWNTAIHGAIAWTPRGVRLSNPDV